MGPQRRAPNSLTITSANGMVRTVGRGEVEELQDLGISLMPEGLHEQLSVRDMADLLVLLREPIEEGEFTPARPVHP